MPFKLLTILGTRPQIIKASVFSNTIEDKNYDFYEVLVNTGQHYQNNLSGDFFGELNIPPPKYDLTSIIASSTSPMTRISRILIELEQIIQLESPDAILVYGDTDSTLAGAWAAARFGVKLIHVEAGLRSFDSSMPEEINRIATDHWSSLLCCPSESAIRQLGQEGIFHKKNGRTVVEIGDLQISAAIHHSKLIHQSRVDNEPRTALITMHRPSNVDSTSKLFKWVRSIIDMLCRYSLQGIFSVHPRTEIGLKKLFGEQWKSELYESGINCLPPLSYKETISQILQADVVLTDSGGLQKEAAVLNTPVLILRPTTEWTEIIANERGLCVKSPEMLITTYKELLCKFKENKEGSSIFGNHNAGKNLAEQINNWLKIID